jgi:hypothetical protein
MTSVGTGLVGGASSSPALIDLVSSRGTGTSAFTDGGFDSLFSRTLEADDMSTASSGSWDQARPDLDREVPLGRADRASVGERRLDAASDDSRVRRADRAARDHDRIDSAAVSTEANDAVGADDVDDTDEAPRTGATGPVPSMNPVSVVAPATPAGATIATTPTLTPGSALEGAALEAIGGGAVATPGAMAGSQPIVPPPALAAIAPALAATASADPAATPGEGATAMPTAGAVGVLTGPESTTAAMSDILGLVAAAASAATGGSDDTPPSMPSMPGSSGAAAPAAAAPAAPAEPAPGAAAPTLDATAGSAALPASSPTPVSVEAVEAAGAAAPEATRAGPGSDEQAAPAAGPQRPAAATEAASAAVHAGRPAADAPTGSTAAPAGPQPPAGAERLADLRRMRERAALGGVRGGSMSVDLSDEGLGPLTLHAQQSASGLHLTLNATDSATRDLLSRQEAALRNDLEASGTALGSLDIQNAGPRSSGGRSGSHGDQGPTRSSLTSANATASAASAVATLTRSRRASSSDGVDLLI